VSIGQIPVLKHTSDAGTLRKVTSHTVPGVSISRRLIDGSGPVSVRLSVTEVHWVAVHAGNTAAAPASEVEAIIRSPTNMTAADGWVISCYATMLATARSSCIVITCVCQCVSIKKLDDDDDFRHKSLK